MAVHKSDQITNIEKLPVVALKANEHSKVVRQYFSFTTPAGTVAVNDTVELVKIRTGVRLLGGVIAFEAMSSGAGTAQIQIGNGTTANKYLDTTSVEAAGTSKFGDTVALAFGEEVAADFTLTATALGEAWAAGKKLLGYVEYLEP